MAPYVPDQQINTGLFIPTTSVFEIQQLEKLDPNSPDFKQLLVRLYQTVNSIALSLNAKDSGYYLTEEFVTGSLYFNPTSSNQLDLRPVFRKVIDVGALGAGVTPTLHGLTIGTTWSFTKIYGVASDTGTNDYYPLPWASAGGATNIELRVDATDVVITNNSGVTFSVCYVVLEYLKQ